MHRAVPPGPHDLRDPARVVAVGFVRHGTHRRLGLARLDADGCNAGLRQTLMEPGRQRTGLKANPLHYHPACPEERDQRLRLAGNARLARNTAPISA
jgi:hypothetical protein